LMSFLPFFMPQTLLDFQSFKFSLFFDLVLTMPKPDTPVSQTGYFGFSSLAKFGHQHHVHQHGSGGNKAPTPLSLSFSLLLSSPCGDSIDDFRLLSSIQSSWCHKSTL
jgi:hypothetical protein